MSFHLASSSYFSIEMPSRRRAALCRSHCRSGICVSDVAVCHFSSVIGPAFPFVIYLISTNCLRCRRRRSKRPREAGPGATTRLGESRELALLSIIIHCCLVCIEVPKVTTYLQLAPYYMF